MRQWPMERWRWARMVGLVAALGAVALGIAMARGPIGTRTLRADDKPSAAAERPYPEGPLGEMVKLGEVLVEQTSTHPMTAEFVGNDLNCTSCHLENGKHATAASFIGVASVYPAWSPREKRVITLEDRVLNCFMRSCDGVRVPLGSKPSVAITAYITWLSAGHQMIMNHKAPLGPRSVPKITLDASKADAVRGKILYTAECASCHGENGQGDAENPPVWGDRSFNRGAGLSHNDKLAAWLKVAMPMEDPHLSEQEALDIAAYVNSFPRRDFNLKEHLPEQHRLGEYNGEHEPAK